VSASVVDFGLRRRRGVAAKEGRDVRSVGAAMVVVVSSVRREMGLVWDAVHWIRVIWLLLEDDLVERVEY
jgi:hypothetical protein